MIEPLLSVNELRTYFFTKRGVIKAVDGVSFKVREKEVVGIVGESGSGKSMTALSIIRLIPAPAAKIVGGNVFFKGENLLLKSEREMQKIRGRGISMILQDPMASLDPVFNIGRQIAETFGYHPKNRKNQSIFEKVLDLLRRVKIPSPEIRMKNYPHQFSGGMRQRIVAAISIASNPELLIADEPTTALDVTIQAQFLQLLKDIIHVYEMGVIYISHNLGVVAQICDRILVMYAGLIVENRTVKDLFENPLHPYTIGLIKSVPRIDQKTERLFQIDGTPPRLDNIPEGCRFWPRCPYRTEVCEKDLPPETHIDDQQYVRCWKFEKVG